MENDDVGSYSSDEIQQSSPSQGRRKEIRQRGCVPDIDACETEQEQEEKEEEEELKNCWICMAG